MKKTIAFGLVLLSLGAGLCADDAKVMPKMVGRVYATPTYSFAPGEYDAEGGFKEYAGNDSVKILNTGFALEYGVIDWITAAVQWAPGWTSWSRIDAASGVKPSNTNGFADIFAGAKIQLAGENAPIRTERFRLALAPGAIIPLPGPDFEEEMKNLAAEENATLSNMDKHVFAAGARVYFDFVLNRNFFINLYNETVFYPLPQDLEKDGPGIYMARAALAGAGFGSAAHNIGGEVNYKYRLTFEVEPVFTTSITDGIDFSIGLPVNVRYSPAYAYSFDIPAALGSSASQIETELNAAFLSEPQINLGITPNVSFFFRKSLIPIELKLQYGLPLYGKNSMARHNATLQFKAYFAFARQR